MTSDDDRKVTANDEEQIIAEERVERYSGRSVAIAFILVGIFFWSIQVILLPFVIAGVFAYVLSPLVDYLTARAKLPRPAIATALFLVVLGLAAGLAYWTVPSVVDEAIKLATDLKGSVTSSIQSALGKESFQLFGKTLNAAELGNKAEAAVSGWIGETKNLVSLATWSFSITFGAFLTLVLFFYFMVDGPRIGTGLLDLAPPKQRPFVRLLWSKIDPALKRYFIGVGAVMTYAAIAAFIGLHFFLHLHHAILLALLTGLFEMIPVIGPLMSAVVAGLVAIRGAASIWDILFYVIYATALRLSIDQLFGPLVLGKAARVPPVLIIFCFLAGGVLFGIVGVILAIPVALIIRITLHVVFDELEKESAQAR